SAMLLPDHLSILLAFPTRRSSDLDTIFSYMTDFDQPTEVLEKHMVHDFQGYPEDYLEKYIERIRAVTVDEMKAVAKKYIHPERLDRKSTRLNSSHVKISYAAFCSK